MFRAPPRFELGRYQTQLSPDDEARYQAEMGPRASDTLDYDMRGWWLAHRGQPIPAEGVHFEDTYKLPNHPTFSDESKVHGVDGFTGGTWGREEGGKDTFTPSPTNLANMGAAGLKDYFREVEPSAVLLSTLLGGKNAR